MRSSAKSKLPRKAMDSLFATPPLDYEAEFDEVRAGYPNQFGREQALKYYLADRLELGEDAPKRIQSAKRNYLAFLARPDQSWRQPLNLKTFFNNWRDFEAMAQESVCPFATRELCCEMRAGGKSICTKHGFGVRVEIPDDEVPF